jgi:hypothetical protein
MSEVRLGLLQNWYIYVCDFFFVALTVSQWIKIRLDKVKLKANVYASCFSIIIIIIIVVVIIQVDDTFARLIPRDNFSEFVRKALKFWISCPHGGDFWKYYHLGCNTV